MEARIIRPRVLVSDSLKDRVDLEQDDDEISVQEANFVSAVVHLRDSTTLVGSLRGIKLYEYRYGCYSSIVIELKTIIADAYAMQSKIVGVNAHSLCQKVQKIDLHYGEDIVEIKNDLGEYIIDSFTMSDADFITGMCIVTLDLSSLRPAL